MEIFIRIEADIISIFVCLVIFINVKIKARKPTRGKDLMMMLVFIIMLLLSFDSIAWGFSAMHNVTGVIIRNIALYFYYFLNNLEPYLWATYVYMQICGNKKRMSFPLIFALPFLVSIILLIINPFTHSIFTIDSMNIYYRGSIFYLNAAMCYIYLLYAQTLPLFNRKRLDRRSYVSLVIFGLPPLIGSIIQFAFLGINLIWAGSAISLLIIHLNMQNKSMNLDYLTGVSNRMHAEAYLASRIKRVAAKGTFAGIMIDIDCFKEINDRFGHFAGDKALEETVKLLRKSIGREAFLSRYGGDEFIVFAEVNNEDALKKLISNISATFEEFCNKSHKGYNLSVSMGYDIFNYKLSMTKFQFIKHIDRLMYHEKRRKKELLAYAVGNINV